MTVIRRFGRLFVVGMILVGSGCATLISGTEQQVTITSTPPGARVLVGHQLSRTPVTFLLPKGRDFPIEVSQGPDVRLVSLSRTIDPMTFLNIIPPLWPGFLVDASTGAMTRYSPSVIHVDFRVSPPLNEVRIVRYVP